MPLEVVVEDVRRGLLQRLPAERGEWPGPVTRVAGDRSQCDVLEAVRAALASEEANRA